LGSFFQGIWDAIVQIFSGVVGFFETIFTGSVTSIDQAWSGITAFFSGIWSGISGAFSAVGSFFSNAFQGAVTGIQNAWAGVTGFFSGIWTGISNAFAGVGSFFSNAFQGAVDGIHNVFSGIGDWFSGLFSNIHIPLPHFSINGKFSLDPPSIPTVGIDWYANGGILTSPTIFGAIGNTLLAGGEAGPEAVAPISELQKYLGNSGKTYNVYIDGIKYNDGDAIDSRITDFVDEIVRRGRMYSNG
jgi:hypothetical protein